MFDTMKICNFRDCNDEHPSCPHDAVNPCHAYRHNETGHWYNELTGQPIRHLHLPNGTTFDIQSWLEHQFIQAAATWNRNKQMKVHEPFEGGVPKQGRSMPAARPPKYTAKECDYLSDEFIRQKATRKDLANKVRELGLALRGYKRMRNKFSGAPILAQRIKDIQDERDTLRELQSQMDKRAYQGMRHLQNSNQWTRKWTPKGGRWEEFVLVCEHNGRLMIIDHSGLRIESQFIYLPDLDGQFMESAFYAEQKLGIERSRWKKIREPKEKIGAPLRRYGKRNANGRRIRARADQKKYAEAVHKLIRDMRAAKLSVFRIRDDKELMKYYFEHVAPKLSRAR